MTRRNSTHFRKDRLQRGVARTDFQQNTQAGRRTQLTPVHCREVDSRAQRGLKDKKSTRPRNSTLGIHPHERCDVVPAAWGLLSQLRSLKYGNCFKGDLSTRVSNSRHDHNLTSATHRTTKMAPEPDTHQILPTSGLYLRDLFTHHEAKSGNA